MVKLLFAWMLIGTAAYGGTVSGKIMGPSGLPVQNGRLGFYAATGWAGNRQRERSAFYRFLLYVDRWIRGGVCRIR